MALSPSELFTNPAVPTGDVVPVLPRKAHCNLLGLIASKSNYQGSLRGVDHVPPRLCPQLQNRDSSATGTQQSVSGLMV